MACGIGAPGGAPSPEPSCRDSPSASAFQSGSRPEGNGWPRRTLRPDAGARPSSRNPHGWPAGACRRNAGRSPAPAFRRPPLKPLEKQAGIGQIHLDAIRRESPDFLPWPPGLGHALLAGHFAPGRRPHRQSGVHPLMSSFQNEDRRRPGSPHPGSSPAPWDQDRRSTGGWASLKPSRFPIRGFSASLCPQERRQRLHPPCGREFPLRHQQAAGPPLPFARAARALPPGRTPPAGVVSCLFPPAGERVRQ